MSLPASNKPVLSPLAHPVEHLQEPLWQFLLPELPAPAIMALSHASRFLYRLVKDAPYISLSAVHAFEEVLPPGLRGQANDWQHLHRILLTYFGALAEMHSGGHAHLHHLPMKTDQQAMDVVWSPVWPVSTLVIPSATVKVDGFDGHEGPPCLGKRVPPYIVSAAALQVSPVDDASPATALIWAVWCLDAIHFVALFLDHGGTVRGGSCSIAVCTADGAVLSKLPCSRLHGNQVAADSYFRRVVSPARDAVLVPDDDQSGSFQLCTLPDLCVRKVFKNPLPPGEYYDSQLGALSWAPDGQYFAVLWYARYGEPALLCIFAAGKCSLVRSWRLAHDLSFGDVQTCDWSPVGKSILMYGCRKSLFDQPPGKDLYLIDVVHLDGLGQFLPVPLLCPCRDISVKWSGCRRFVFVAYLIDDFMTDGATRRCIIWSCGSLRAVFSWQHGAGSVALSGHNMAWDRRNQCFHDPICKSIVYLPEGVREDVRQVPFVSSSCAALSPGGQKALTCSQSATHAASSLHTVPMQWQLFHYDIDKAASTCQRHLVVKGGAAWNLGSVAWHPGPTSSHLYAIMNDQGSLFLMNGSIHQQLAQWTWQELSGSQHPACPSIEAARLVRLRWSPDGLQLAMLACGHTALISYG